jgi:SWI/SNF related-matrix-associated actin-dependent regulator of chromatin subfamily C
MAIVAAERFNLAGESSNRGQLTLNLENVSYGQLQAVSAVTAESVGSDLERSDGGNSGYVVTPPQIMDGKGVVKRFWSRLHVVPMHSGVKLSLSFTIFLGLFLGFSPPC